MLSELWFAAFCSFQNFPQTSTAQCSTLILDFDFDPPFTPRFFESSLLLKQSDFVQIGCVRGFRRSILTKHQSSQKNHLGLRVGFESIRFKVLGGPVFNLSLWVSFS